MLKGSPISDLSGSYVRILDAFLRYIVLPPVCSRGKERQDMRKKSRLPVLQTCVLGPQILTRTIIYLCQPFAKVGAPS